MNTALSRAAVVGLVLATAAAGCGSNPYGYAHRYEPLDEERPYMERSVELPYEEVRRTRPEMQRMVGWFGVLTEPPQFQADGSARLTLSLRAHRDRHLCATSSSDSCRVTVSEREIGRFTAIVNVRPEDREGRLRLWTGSLVKVYGTATGEEDASGGPVLRVDWYRHWPPHFYVTTGAAGAMRR
jgi:hypothetical protein